MSAAPTATTVRNPPDTAARAVSRPATADAHLRTGIVRAAIWLIALALVTSGLYVIAHRTGVPPVIEADNAYIFLAADRLFAGQGATTIPPRAPLQPWTWRSDWVFLTQWPVGYPALICGVRAFTGCSTATSATFLALICCATALVGWFAWARSCLPRSVVATLIGLVAAGASFSMDSLVNPASDTVLLAALPLILLLTCRAFGGHGDKVSAPTTARLIVAGAASGLLFWVRYAAIFVPIAIGLVVLCDWAIMRRSRLRHVLAFSVAAALPVAGLLMLNGALGASTTIQEQYNLGKDISWDASWSIFSTAWMKFSQQSPYAYRPEAEQFYAAWLPAGSLGLLLLLTLSVHRVRTPAVDWCRKPGLLLSFVCVATLLSLLVAASVLFAGKYNYVGLVRYYQPVRPLYFLLFLGPVALVPWRMLRAAACVPLVLVLAWFVNQDVRRAHARAVAEVPERTPYGRAARHFAPGSRELFAWLRTQSPTDLVVFSNFHEEIALETGIPACPTPRDEAEMAEWLTRIRAARGLRDVRVLFILHPDNDYRAYYLDPPGEIVARFNLTHPADVADAARAYVHAPTPTTPEKAGSRHTQSEPAS